MLCRASATQQGFCATYLLLLVFFLGRLVAMGSRSPPKISSIDEIVFPRGTSCGGVGPCRGSVRHGLAYLSTAPKTRSHKHSSISEKLPCARPPDLVSAGFDDASSLPSPFLAHSKLCIGGGGGRGGDRGDLLASGFSEAILGTPGSVDSTESKGVKKEASVLHPINSGPTYVCAAR